MATLPDAYAFGAKDAGSHLWLASFILRTAGSQTVRAIDSQTGAVLAESVFVMSPGDCSALTLEAPASVSAGAAVPLTVRARDGFGNAASRTLATLVLETSDAAAGVPTNLALSGANGGVLSLATGTTLRTAGTQTLRVTDGNITSPWVSVEVQATTAVALRVSDILSGRAGSSSQVRVAAVDTYGNVVPTYTGTLSFSSSDPMASLPQGVSIAAADLGTHTWDRAVTLGMAGAQWVRATDGQLSGQQEGIAVAAAGAVGLRVTAAASATAGTPVDCAVAAVDAYGNIDANYGGAFALSSTDLAATLPAQASFAAHNAGTLSFPAGCLFTTAGAQTLTATDVARALARGSAGVAVQGASAVSMRVGGLASPSSWRIPQQLTVALLDVYGNPAQYTGTVTLQSQDPNAVFQLSHTYTPGDQGSTQFAVTLGSLGTFAVSAQYSQNAALQGNQTVRVRRVESVNAQSDDHVCATLDGGEVKCWGSNVGGQLAVGDGAPRGLASGQMGAALPAVQLGTGRTALAVSTGYDFTCVLLDSQQVKCWGLNSRGSLGLGDQLDRGMSPASMGDALPTVQLGTGRSVVGLAAGDHACVVLDDASVKCWGHNQSGECGTNGFSDYGFAPGQMGDNVAAAALGSGRTAVQVTTSSGYSCAVLDNGQVACWGNWAGLVTSSFTGVTAVEVHLGGYLCARLSDGSVVCSVDGTPAGLSGTPLPVIALGTGRTATSLAVGSDAACAVLDNGQLKCWGSNAYGQLGLGDTRTRRSAATLGDSLPAVDLGTGRTAIAVTGGNRFTCALLDTHQVKCWGYNGYGELGLGDNQQRGSAAGQMGDALGVVPLW